MTQAEEKLGDISTLLINIHHILNGYRPHQAREAAIDLLQTRLDQARAETATIRSKTEMARKVLEGLGSIEAPRPFVSAFADQKRRGSVKALWAAMDDL